MRDLNQFLRRGYLLQRTRGHWTEMIVFSVMASIVSWAIRVACGFVSAVIGVIGMYYMFTR